MERAQTKEEKNYRKKGRKKEECFTREDERGTFS